MRRRGLTSLLAFVLVVGGAGVAGAGRPATAGGRGSSPCIGRGNVDLFARAFDLTFAAALKPLSRKLAGLHQGGGGQEHKVAFTIPGPKGSMKVAGFGLLSPAPRRWELTLRF